MFPFLPQKSHHLSLIVTPFTVFLSISDSCVSAHNLIYRLPQCMTDILCLTVTGQTERSVREERKSNHKKRIREPVAPGVVGMNESPASSSNTNPSLLSDLLLFHYSFWSLIPASYFSPAAVIPFR
jgi:hypothetical protein